MYKRVLSILVIAALAASPAFGDTYIPEGNVSGVWDIAGSPYLILGNITVPVDSMLTIEPGVVVDFQDPYELAVNGVLYAVGTEIDSILFTGPAAPAGPGWRGIRFINGQEGSQISYCIIRNGRDVVGAPYDRGGGIYMYLSNPTISHSTITNCYANIGAGIYCELSDPVISDNQIVGNGAGLAYITSNAHGAGMYFVNSTPQITGNHIADNLAHAATIFTYPTHARGGGIYLEYSDALISRNTIVNNTADASGYTADARGGGIYCENSNPDIINNTLSGNAAVWGPQPTEGGGISLFSSNPIIKNNIVEGSDGGGIYFESSGGASVTYSDFYDNEDGNFIGSGIPAGLGNIVTVNANGDPCDVYYNILLDPLFVDPVGGDFHLQAGSPCVDAGDPSSPYDPDGTIADMGAFYYDQSAPMPDVTITLTPYNPPITVPASGGSFDYNAMVMNNEPIPMGFDVWIMVQLPSGSWFGPVLGPVDLMLSSGQSVARDRSQYVPAGAPAGTYIYEGYVGFYPGEVWNSDSFTFEKTAAGNGSPVSGWTNSGQALDEQLAEPEAELPSVSTLVGAYPNPFNPVTTIGYRLSAVSFVNLSVYDFSGRMVAELVNGWRDTGVHEVMLDGSDLASGIYIYRLQVGDFTLGGKMVLLK